MKYTASLLTGVTLLAFVSCKKQPQTFNDNHIPVNKCQAFNRDGKILTCCLDSVIQDSRCPVNALCIWEGIAVARFKVSSQNTDHIITLATYKFPPYNKDTTVAGFKIEFINLLPKRELNKQFNYNDYVVELNVMKL